MAETINVLALVKDDNRYIFIFDDDNIDEMLRQFGRFAGDSSLNFTWYDADLMREKARQLISKVSVIIPFTVFWASGYYP
jgi:hypothetical protein